ncbi:hypothetical protein GEMRC1_010551 [Eukaryota sp. GEM-RC1]
MSDPNFPEYAKSLQQHLGYSLHLHLDDRFGQLLQFSEDHDSILTYTINLDGSLVLHCSDSDLISAQLSISYDNSTSFFFHYIFLLYRSSPQIADIHTALGDLSQLLTTPYHQAKFFEALLLFFHHCTVSCSEPVLPSSATSSSLSTPRLYFPSLGYLFNFIVSLESSSFEDRLNLDFTLESPSCKAFRKSSARDLKLFLSRSIPHFDTNLCAFFSFSEPINALNFHPVCDFLFSLLPPLHLTPTTVTLSGSLGGGGVAEKGIKKQKKQQQKKKKKKKKRHKEG